MPKNRLKREYFVVAGVGLNKLTINAYFNTMFFALRAARKALRNNMNVQINIIEKTEES